MNNEKTYSSRLEITDKMRSEMQYALEQAFKQQERYLKEIRSYIEDAQKDINNFNKIHMLGGFAAKLISNTPTIQSEYFDTLNKDEEENAGQMDEKAEFYLEYALSLSLATSNDNKDIIPTADDIAIIYDKLNKINDNYDFFEMAKGLEDKSKEAEFSLKYFTMLNYKNVRGPGYMVHINEIYKELFRPFSDFLKEYHGFDADDLYLFLQNLEMKFYSKIASELGLEMSHLRYREWCNHKGQNLIVEEMQHSGRHFIQQFLDDNPDMKNSDIPLKISLYNIDDINAYDKLFWVVPNNHIEDLICQCLSIKFGDNHSFLSPPKYSAFPLNDTIIHTKPIIQFNDKYYCFSTLMIYRNLFEITRNLIRSADATYFDHSFLGSSNKDSRDNYCERKIKSICEILLPDVEFYLNVNYKVVEDGIKKEPELDLLGISDDSIYLIEVKAGELQKKHKRGYLKGLKDKLKEIINKSLIQCHRAYNFIKNSAEPVFFYTDANKKKSIHINSLNIKQIYTISVTFENVDTLTIGLKELYEAGIIDEWYTDTWIVSIYDLMVFADLIESQEDFNEYLDFRLMLNSQDNVKFYDEIDILGFYLKGNFPLNLDISQEDTLFKIMGFKDDIDEYYNKVSLGIPGANKPKKFEIER